MNEKNVLNKLLKQGPKESLSKTNAVLKGYLSGLGYGKLSGVLRDELQKRLIMHMERKNLWNLGKNKVSFLSSRGSNKRKRSKVPKKSSRKSAKILKKKKSETLSVVEKSASQKPKRKLSKKKCSVKKKKCKKQQEDEKLPDRYLLPDELQFEKFLFERKGFRINPIKRDGNCLFASIADQVYGVPDLHETVRSWCVSHMKANQEVFSQWIDHDRLDFNQYINVLKLNTSWGGTTEIKALSEVFACSIEVYRDSENPTVFAAGNIDGNVNHTIRIFFANSHYSSVRSDGQGVQLFNFQALQPGELEKQMALLADSHNIQNVNVSEQDPSAAEEEAVKQSIAIDKAFKNYLRFYAARIIKQNCRQQQ